VGTRIWELCDGRNVSEIVRALVADYEVEPAQALSDVQRFVGELVQAGALTLGEESTAHG